MNRPQLDRERSICTRKERRYKTSEEHVLRCETVKNDVDDSSDEPASHHGTVVDLSTSGIRLLSDGRFCAGDAICVELSTDRSHGIYRGVVRRVEPWVGGQAILGCSLDDSIADAVLQDLASEGVVNRRADGRVHLSHSAKVSWQLNAEVIDVEIQDYSDGGMKIQSPVSIPEGVSLRIQIGSEFAEMLSVQAKLVWKHDSADGCVAGVAFTHRDAPVQVAEALGISNGADPQNTRKKTRWRRLGFAAAVTLVVVGLLHASGTPLPWAIAWTP
ncbi:MAG: PilZ domain-containing protein [Rubripirellula sp.]